MRPSNESPEAALNARVRAAYHAVSDEARAEKVAKQHGRGKQTAHSRAPLPSSRRATGS